MKRIALLLLAFVLFPSVALGAPVKEADKRLKIWFDTGGGPGESYGTVLQNGAAAAAKDLDVDITFVYSDWSAEKMLENFRQGLASKPKTSDTREAPAQVLICSLLDAGARVQAHDPRAVEETRMALGDRQGLVYVHEPYDAVNGADALVVVTEWDIYRQPDFGRIRHLLRQPLIVDGRNLYSRSEMRRQGFEYLSVGRPAVLGRSD